MRAYPQRIVCLTEETTDILYRLRAGDRVVGVPGFLWRPRDARRKPRVCTFVTARLDRIDALRPDLVLAFSDLQADMVAALVKRGHQVVAFNQRSIEGIYQTIGLIGGLIGAEAEATHLCGNLAQGLTAIRMSAERLPKRPRVFFEEWPNPMISGIQWVEELIEIAGGEPIFPGLRHTSLATGRVVTPEAVRDAAPDVIVASWCGKRVRKATILARSEWQNVPAIRHGHVFEIRSTYILQPGPMALTEGLRQIHAVLCQATGVMVPPPLAPDEDCDLAMSRFAGE